MSERKSYAVLGLGIFGSAVAKTLANAGMDVVAIDSNMAAVDNISSIVTNAVQADVQDINALREAGVSGVDAAVIAMGSHLEDSILAIMNLRELGVTEIIAKANNMNYFYVMQRIGATQVIQPEKEMGRRLATRLLSPNILDLTNVDDTYSVIELKAPKRWTGIPLKELNLRVNYGVNIIGLKSDKDGQLRADLSADTVILETDILVLIADTKKFSRLNLDK